MKNLSWRFYAVCAVILLSVVYILPTLNPSLWPHKTINLGLDLQGGMHLVLEVQAEKAVDSTLERISHEMRDQMKKERIRYEFVTRTDNRTIEVRISDSASTDSFLAFRKKEFGDLSVKRHDDNDAAVFRLSLPDEMETRIRKMATEQALETIRNRIDQFGVSEPDIRIQGENRILVQLPGVDDPERAKGLIGKTALLEFKLVDDEHDLSAALNGKVPPGSEILHEIERDATGDVIGKTPYLIKKRTLLTGAALTDARVQIDSQFNEPYVAIDFDKKGGRLFARITGENVQKRLAIVLDNKVYSAPVIQDKITGGAARITGNYTMETAHDLAIVLRAGALPAPVKILEERTVGPTLGADSIRKGLLSMAVGGALVVVFMIIYYSAAGLIADVALCLNILLIGAGLAAFGATLTLPGIAGIILTLGMAVDANVLIFERIREEIALGRSPIAAIQAGFERATLTILDANVTTLIAAVVLFQFGTGPVKGFAVTLSLGVISSMFTALIVSRLLFDTLYGGNTVKKLSI